VPDWCGVTLVYAEVWDLKGKSGEVRSGTGLSICSPTGVGGTNAIVGGCGDVTTAGAGIVTVGVAVLENVKGRALMGGSS
jgi:hypothetical protein